MEVINRDENTGYRALQSIVQRTPGLIGVVVSDVDGVKVVSEMKRGEGADGGDGRRSLSGSMENASIASELADLGEKLSLGKCRSIVEYFEDSVVVYFLSSLLITKVIGEKNANLGLLLGMADDMELITANLEKVLEENPAPTPNRMFEE